MIGSRRRDGTRFGPFMCTRDTLAQKARGDFCERGAQRLRLVEGGCD